jgi:hypothetical protein
VSRRSDKEDPAAELLARVIYDLIPFLPAYNSNQWVSHFIYYYTTMDFVYCHSRKYQALDTIAEFLNIIKTRYSRTVKYFRTNSKRTLGQKFNTFIAVYRISTEHLAPATPA